MHLNCSLYKNKKNKVKIYPKIFLYFSKNLNLKLFISLLKINYFYEINITYFN